MLTITTGFGEAHFRATHSQLVQAIEDWAALIPDDVELTDQATDHFLRNRLAVRIRGRDPTTGLTLIDMSRKFSRERGMRLDTVVLEIDPDENPAVIVARLKMARREMRLRPSLTIQQWMDRDTDNRSL